MKFDLIKKLSLFEHMKPFLLFLIVYPLLTGGISAQEVAKRHFRTLFLERPNDAPKSLHLFNGKESFEVKLPKLNFSDVYEIPSGMDSLVFTPNPITDPLQIPSGAPQIKIPKNITFFYLLVFSDPKNKVSPIRFYFVDAGINRFKSGQTLWFNLTDHTIAGKLGGVTLIIEPKAQSITNAPTEGNQDYPIELIYKAAGDDKFMPICSTHWPHSTSARKVAFVIPAKTKLPVVMSFFDFGMEKKDKDETTPPAP